MKPMLKFIFCIGILALACGTQFPTQTSTDVNKETHTDTLPAKVSISAEPTAGLRQGIISADVAVNVRDCEPGQVPSTDCKIVGQLVNGQGVLIVDTVRGRGCRNWHVIHWFGAHRYVCAEYVSEEKMTDMNTYSSWHNGKRYQIHQTSPITVTIDGVEYEETFLLFSAAYDFCVKKIDEMKGK